MKRYIFTVFYESETNFFSSIKQFGKSQSTFTAGFYLAERDHKLREYFLQHDNCKR